MPQVNLLRLYNNEPLEIGKCPPRGACTTGWEPWFRLSMKGVA